MIAFLSLTLSNNRFHVQPLSPPPLADLDSFLVPRYSLQDHTVEGTARRGEHPTFSFSRHGPGRRRPTVGVLLILVFAQQIAFSSFEQLLALFALTSLGLGAY